MKTRNYIFLIGFFVAVLVMGLISAGGKPGDKISDAEVVWNKSLSLKAASSSTDTMLLESDVFSIDCDTLGFALELYAADSMWEGATSVTFSTDPYVTKLKPAETAVEIQN